MNLSQTADPFMVLGVSPDDDEERIRLRYLELVKKYPPDREPERFRQIRAAFEAAKNPLAVAKRLIAPPSDEAPKWADVLEAQQQNPPRLSPAFVLSLGNRAASDTGGVPPAE